MKTFIVRASCGYIFFPHIYIFILYFYFPSIYLSRNCIFTYHTRPRACTRVILQFQENISTSRENKIYNENKVESKNKIDDAEMKFIRKLRIAKAPAGKCHETHGEISRNQCSFASVLLEVTIRYEISQSGMRI